MTPACPPHDDNAPEDRDRSVRRQIAALRTGVPVEPPAPAVAPLPPALRHMHASPQSRGDREETAMTPPTSLELLVPGREHTSDEGEALWLVTEEVATARPEYAGLAGELAEHLGHTASALHRRAKRALPGGALPEDLLLIDLETTGLSNTPLFLIGALTVEDGALVVRQYFARHYGEERAAIAAFLEAESHRRLLVSYNGASFDLPFLTNRAHANRVPIAPQSHHLDLLFSARKHYRGKLPNCQLQTLERHLCGRERTDDIPGRLIPEAYHEFVAGGEAHDIARILEHNRLDLITLAELMVRIGE
jgi:uncharacterized protein YprB with RNaseH-like and TPR domain